MAAPYNFAANQVQSAPVTGFYQGRALRLAEEQQKQKMEDEQRRLEIAEKQMVMQQQQMQQQQEWQQEQRKIGILGDMYDISGQASFAAKKEYQRAKTSGLSEEEAIAAGQASFDRDWSYVDRTLGQFLGDSRVEVRELFTFDIERVDAAITKYADPQSRPGLLQDTVPKVTLRNNRGEIVITAAPGTPEYDAAVAQGAVPGEPPGRLNQEMRQPVVPHTIPEMKDGVLGKRVRTWDYESGQWVEGEWFKDPAGGRSPGETIGEIYTFIDENDIKDPADLPPDYRLIWQMELERSMNPWDRQVFGSDGALNPEAAPGTGPTNRTPAGRGNTNLAEGDEEQVSNEDVIAEVLKKWDAGQADTGVLDAILRESGIGLTTKELLEKREEEKRMRNRNSDAVSSVSDFLNP